MSKKHVVLNKKNHLGQFFSKNTDMLLHGFESFVKDKIVIDPFAGDYDLIQWGLRNGASAYKAYDIDPKRADCVSNDSLLNPPNLSGLFLLTNPPYLHLNRAKEKSPAFYKWGMDNLYKCHLASLSYSNCSEGIMIIPANFICEINPKAREVFFRHYEITKLVYWEDQILDDVSIALIVFHFQRCKKPNYKIPVFFPGLRDLSPRKRARKESGPPWLPLDLGFDPTKDKEILLDIKPDNNYLGGNTFWEWLGLCKDKDMPQTYKSNIVVRIVDGFYRTTETQTKIHFDWKYYISKEIDHVNTYRAGLYFNEGDEHLKSDTARSNFPLMLPVELSIPDQKRLCLYFNDQFEHYRAKYHSLFLSNFISPYQKIVPQSIIWSVTYRCCIDLGFLKEEDLEEAGLEF